MLGLAALYGQQPTVDRNIDFRNFAYPFPVQKVMPVPDKLAWMSLNVKTTVTLANGRYDFDQANPSEGPSLILDRVLYGYLTSAKQLDAVATPAGPLTGITCMPSVWSPTHPSWLVGSARGRERISAYIAWKSRIAN